jgi:hypothetical protein
MSRHCILGAGAVVPALAALLLAAPARAVEADKLLPNDTETVITINVKQILTSPLAKKTPLIDKAREFVKDQGEASQVLTDLGFDPFTDLESIVLAFSGASEPDRGLVILHGKFDQAKFKAKAEETAKDMENVLKIHKVPDGRGGETELYEANIPGVQHTMYVALAGKNSLVASGGKDYVLDAIDKEAGKKKSQLKSQGLQALLARVDGTQSVWLAVLGSTLAKSQLANTDEAKQIIDKLDDATAGLTLSKDLKLEVSVTAKNADDARELGAKIRKGLNTALALAGGLAAQNEKAEPLVDALKAVKPKIKGKVIGVQLDLSGEDIDKAINK